MSFDFFRSFSQLQLQSVLVSSTQFSRWFVMIWRHSKGAKIQTSVAALTDCRRHNTSAAMFLHQPYWPTLFLRNRVNFRITFLHQLLLTKFCIIKYRSMQPPLSFKTFKLRLFWFKHFVKNFVKSTTFNKIQSLKWVFWKLVFWPGRDEAYLYVSSILW